MGMRTHKHAVVLVMPRGGGSQDVDERHVAAMQRAVHEYVTMAQFMQPPPSRESDAATDGRGTEGIETTRLLLSLNILSGTTADDAEMARPVAINGQACQVARQISRNLEAQVNKWRQQQVNPTVRSNGGQAQQDEPMMRLLEDLAKQQFRVSVISPADALPVLGDTRDGTDRLTKVLNQQSKIQFVMLRDEDEQSSAASKRMLELFRAIKSTTAKRACSIRQVEECELELQAIVKEWLYIVAPTVHASLSLPRAPRGGEEREQERVVKLQIRANYVLLSNSENNEPPTTPWMALDERMSRMALHHFVPLQTVHPAVLIGCPLHASSSSEGEDSGIHAISMHKYLHEQQLGAIMSYSNPNGIDRFYLMVATPTSGATPHGLLMYQVASAEEILIPEVDQNDEVPAAPSVVAPGIDEKVAAEIEELKKFPTQPFNPFSNRSGVLSMSSVRGHNVNTAKPSPRTTLAKRTTGPFENTLRSPLPTTTQDPYSSRPPTSKRKKRL